MVLPRPFDVMGLEEGIALQHIGNQVAVGQHCALGHARGATGVLQHRQIVAVENRRAVRRFCAGFQYGIQLECPGNRERGHHALHMFDEEINQRALGLGVEISDLGDHDGLDAVFGSTAAAVCATLACTTITLTLASLS